MERLVHLALRAATLLVGLGAVVLGSVPWTLTYRGQEASDLVETLIRIAFLSLGMMTMTRAINDE